MTNGPSIQFASVELTCGAKAAASPQHSKVRCIALLLLLIPLLLWHHAIATIPTPSDVALVPGYLRWSNSQWALELDTGRIAKTDRHDVLFDEDGKVFGIDYLEDTEQLAVSIDVPGTGQPTERAVVDLGGLPTILSGRYLIRETRDQLRAVDLESKDLRVVSATVTPASPTTHGGDTVWLIPIRGTNRFLRDNFGSRQADVTLYQIEPDQIRTLNTWRGMGQISCCDDRIYINRTSAKEVEVRSATDGSLIETIPFPSERHKLLPNSYGWLNQDWLVFSNSDSTEYVCFDLARKLIVELPGKDYNPFRSEKSPYAVLSSDNFDKSGVLLIYDRQRQEVIQKVRSPLQGGRFAIHDESHLLFTNQAHGISAVLVDILTGREVGRWTPFAWTSWSTLLFCPLMLVWTIAWCRSSARWHDWAWVDIVMVGGLMLTIAAYRIESSAYVSLATLLTCSTLLLSLIQFAGWHVMLQIQPLVARVSTLILSLGVAQSVYVEVVAQYANEYRWALFFACATSLPCIAIIGGVMRWSGRGLRRQNMRRFSASIYDYMILIAAMAVFSNSIRMTMNLEGGRFGSWDFIQFLVAPSILSVSGPLIGLLPSRRRFVAGLGLAFAGALLVVGYRLVELIAGDSPLCMLERFWYPSRHKSQSYIDTFTFEFPEIAEAMLVGLFTPFLATIPFRLRGWTLKKDQQLLK